MSFQFFKEGKGFLPAHLNGEIPYALTYVPNLLYCIIAYSCDYVAREKSNNASCCLIISAKCKLHVIYLTQKFGWFSQKI